MVRGGAPGGGKFALSKEGKPRNLRAFPCYDSFCVVSCFRLVCWLFAGVDFLCGDRGPAARRGYFDGWQRQSWRDECEAGVRKAARESGVWAGCFEGGGGFWLAIGGDVDGAAGGMGDCRLGGFVCAVGGICWGGVGALFFYLFKIPRGQGCGGKRGRVVWRAAAVSGGECDGVVGDIFFHALCFPCFAIGGNFSADHRLLGVGRA